MEWALAIIALTLLAVAGGSRLLSGTPVTPAMVLTAAGVLAGPLVLDGVDLSAEGSTVRTLAEATLALVLFSDAARVDLRELRQDLELPVRLLGVGLPLTIAAGALAAVGVLGDLSLTEALVLSVLLAPTDAALGQAVVTSPKVPERIRQGLNVESGLNDGICVPLLLIVLATAEAESHVQGSGEALRITAEEVGYGLLAGLGVSVLVAGVVLAAERRSLIAATWRGTAVVAGAFLAYGVSTALGGSGFIAAFVAGLAFGHLVRGDKEPLTAFDEELGQLLDGVTFVVFGAVLLGPALEDLTWPIAAYALLSLTVVRMVPVALATLRSGAGRPTVAFLGWFGPRGLASIVFAVIVVEESRLPHVGTIVVTTYVTIGLSVLLHGLTAAPLADRYARWYAGHAPERRPAMESAPGTAGRPREPG